MGFSPESGSLGWVEEWVGGGGCQVQAVSLGQKILLGALSRQGLAWAWVK